MLRPCDQKLRIVKRRSFTSIFNNYAFTVTTVPNTVETSSRGARDRAIGTTAHHVRQLIKLTACSCKHIPDGFVLAHELHRFCRAFMIMFISATLAEWKMSCLTRRSGRDPLTRSVTAQDQVQKKNSKAQQRPMSWATRM